MIFFPVLISVLYGSSLLFWFFRFQGRLPFHLDARLYAYPDHIFNLQCFQAGRLPLWNPFIACGTPHLANWQSACFYPPFWLFNLTGLGDWYMGMALAHAAWAFIGFYAWSRSRESSALSSAMGAFVFAGSAHLVCCWANLPFMATASWIPWVFFAARKLLLSQKSGTLFLFSFMVSMQVLAGYPFFSFDTLLVLLIWLVFQRPHSRQWLAFFGALTLAAALTCLQWLPFLDFLSYGWHDRWTDNPYFNKFTDYLTLLSPTALGVPNTLGYRGSFANANYDLYFGLIPLLLLIFQVAGWKKMRERFWTFGAFGLLIWTAGPHFFLWRWIPLGVLEFLEPSKAAGLFVFSAATAVAGSFLPGGNKPRWIWTVLIALTLVDLGLLPFRLEQPLPDPYSRPNFQQNAAQLRRIVGDHRFLSLHTSAELTSTDALASFDRPIDLFLPNSNQAEGLRTTDRYLFLQVDGSQNLTLYMNKGAAQGFRGGLWDVAGVRYLLMPEVPRDPRYRTLQKWGEDILIENQGALPDARFVTKERFFGSRPEVLSALIRPGSDWKNDAALEKDRDGNVVSLPMPQHPRTDIDDPDGYQRPSPTEMTYRKKFPSKGIVIWNETYAPGWRAWIDGKPQPILRAYGLFMALAVDAGPHQIELRYEPVSFRLGFFISLLGCWGALGWLAIRTQRRQTGL